MYFILYLIPYTFYRIPYTVYLIPYTLYLTWTFAGHQWASHQAKKSHNKTPEVFFHAAFDFDAPGLQNTDKKWKNNRFLKKSIFQKFRFFKNRSKYYFNGWNRNIFAWGIRFSPPRGLKIGPGAIFKKSAGRPAMPKMWHAKLWILTSDFNWCAWRLWERPTRCSLVPGDPIFPGRPCPPHESAIRSPHMFAPDFCCARSSDLRHRRPAGRFFKNRPGSYF